MLMARIIDNQIVDFIDTDKPENYPEFTEIPEHVPSNSDVRFFHSDWTLKTEEQLLSEGLITLGEEEVGGGDVSEEDEARAQRDKLLFELDSIVSNPLRWQSFSDDEKLEMAKYRQDLLDVPQQEGFPEDIEWPEPPK